jgi:hypothetical protein
MPNSDEIVSASLGKDAQILECHCLGLADISLCYIVKATLHASVKSL